MTNFKILHSVLSPVDIGLFVGENYGLTNSSCKLLKTGINHTYFVQSDQGKFVFRIYSLNWRTQEEINEELFLLDLLKENQLSISYPIADAGGNFIQRLSAPEGERFAVLFSYAHGHKIHNYDGHMHFKIGQLMGQIHTCTEGKHLNRMTYDTDVLLHKSMNFITEFLSDETEEIHFLKQAQETLEATLIGADFSQLRKGIVHLDIWFDNLNISENEEVTLFDFDFCGNGWLCMDIAYYVLQIYNTEKNPEDREDKIKHFFNGYESIMGISKEEKRLLPTLGVCLYYFYLGVQCQRFENWSNTFLNEAYLKRFITVLIKGYYDSHVLEHEQ